jgi:hypothetical protein
MAADHGRLHDSFIEIKNGSEQHKAWIAYFGLQGWSPYTLRHVDMNAEKSWTAPCEWPDSLPAETPNRLSQREPAREAAE